MTALKRFQRLESPGIWREHAEAQRRNVILSFGDASLVVSDTAERVLTHWSLAALERLNPGGSPALYAPGADSDETLEVDDALMIEALETVRMAVDKGRPRPGRLRLAIFAAIAAGDVARAEACLAGLDVNARHGALAETALYHALSVEARSVEMVRMLLDAGADPNAGMAEGYRPLHAVAAYPWGWEVAATKALLADLLVAAGGDIEARTEGRGWTPLHRAVLEGSADEVEALLRAGADPNAPFDGRSEPWFTAGRLPLQIAGHDTAKVRLLLEYGADPRRTDALGEDTARYLNALIAEHIAHRAEEDAQRAALESSLALVRGWSAPS